MKEIPHGFRTQQGRADRPPRRRRHRQPAHQRRATPAPPLRPIWTTGPKFRSSDRSSSFRFLPPHLAGTSVPAFFSAADPERDPFGRRARAMRGAPALLRRPERRPAGIGRPARIGRSPACSTNRLPPPASPPRSAPTPKPSAGAISRTAASTAATGWREISTAPAGGRSSSASAVPASLPGKWTEYVAVLIMLLWLVPDPSGLAGVTITAT